MSSKLTSFLSEKIKHYSSLITEADDSFDMSKLGDIGANNDKEDSPEADEQADVDIDDSEDTPNDPTKLGSEGDIPEGEDGSFVSDTKLANFASILLKAYQTQAPESIPSNLLNVTRQNANEVIKFIEDKLQLAEPTQDVVNKLGNI